MAAGNHFYILIKARSGNLSLKLNRGKAILY